jgi:hypothetical protein
MAISAFRRTTYLISRLEPENGNAAQRVPPWTIELSTTVPDFCRLWPAKAPATDPCILSPKPGNDAPMQGSWANGSLQGVGKNKSAVSANPGKVAAADP